MADEKLHQEGQQEPEGEDIQYTLRRRSVPKLHGPSRVNTGAEGELTAVQEEEEVEQITESPQKVGFDDLFKLITNMNTDIAKQNADMITEINNLKQQTMDGNTELRKEFRDNLAQLNQKIDNNELKMTEFKTRLQEEIKDKFTQQNAIMEQLSVKVQTQITKQNNNIQNQYKEIKTQVEQKWTDLQNIIQETKEITQIETRQNIETLQTQINDSVEARITEVQELINHNKITLESKINESETTNTRQQLERMETELNNIRDKPILIQGLGIDNRDVPLFRKYTNNPIEFLHRLEEYLTKIREQDWGKIKFIVDNCFNGVAGYWWDAVRDKVNDYTEFTNMFRQKYWSPSIQHVVRDRIENGNYDPNGGMTPTNYFLNKVISAKHLEPTIPEECLCIKLSYHFEDSIRRARLSAQIKTTSDMELLLAEYENDTFYRKRRENKNVMRNDYDYAHTDNKQPSSDKYNDQTNRTEFNYRRRYPPRGNYRNNNNRQWDDNNRRDTWHRDNHTETNRRDSNEGNNEQNMDNNHTSRNNPEELN